MVIQASHQEINTPYFPIWKSKINGHVKWISGTMTHE